jgi:glycosyltransferase involved in cell wall biosynthesis
LSTAPPRGPRHQLGLDGAGDTAGFSSESRYSSESPLRIAMLAPPWISVPSAGYGGVESMVSTLTEALVRIGHDVTLFCAPGSASRAEVVTLLDEPHPNEIERALFEVDHVAQAFDRIELTGDTDPFDVIHDHSGFTALAMANRVDTPLVHTLHGPFTTDTAAFYARHGRKGTLVGISRAQLRSAPHGLKLADPIPNPIDLRAWPLEERKGDYLLWIGRMTPEKGPHRAIAAARAVDVPIILAGVIQPGQQEFFDREIAPHIDGKRVRFVGEVGGSAKRALFARARGLGRISPRDCRAWVAQHCDSDVVAAAYERAYRAAVATSRPLEPALA